MNKRESLGIYLSLFLTVVVLSVFESSVVIPVARPVRAVFVRREILRFHIRVSLHKRLQRQIDQFGIGVIRPHVGHEQVQVLARG
jgi:hypothetical protein